MPVTERVMGLGDWSLKLRDETPYDIRSAIATPFSQIVITPGRLPGSTTSDATFLGAAIYCGVILRPGPQFELGGCSLAWYLGDDAGGAGFLIDGKSIAAGTLASAVTTTLSGSAFTNGTIGSGSVVAWETGSATRRDILGGLAQQLGFEWRVNPDRTVDVASVATLYGSTPTAVIARKEGPQSLAAPYGITGRVGSTWDWESYGSKVYVWTNQGRGSSGGASTYRDPGGNLMTIVRGYEQPDAPPGSETTVADWYLGQINRSVRTVEVDSTVYAVTDYAAPCGSSVWLYDLELGLWDSTNNVQFGGAFIHPVSARVVSVTWPIERGMGCFVRQHDGTSASYVDLTDWVEWESPGARFEISTTAQQLAPPTSAPLEAVWRSWAQYTPEWRAQTGNPTNYTATGRYRRTGTRVDVSVTITANTGATFGSGAFMTVTMPPNCVGRSVTNLVQTGTVAYTRPGTETVRGECWVGAGGTDMNLVYLSPWASPTPAASPFTGAAPVAWAVGDIININASFEVDP